jgi:DNA-directed RNA polymerase specialized sigma24 family protein
VPAYDLGENDRIKASRRSFDDRVRDVAEQARAAHADPTVTVRHVEPWSLKERPAPAPRVPRVPWRQRNADRPLNERETAREARQARAVELAEAGLSNREIQQAMGVGYGTVLRDLRAAGML